MNYPQTVQSLYSLGNEMRSMKLRLDEIRQLAAALGDPQNSYEIVHVAGTNGKGSVCAMIDAGLRAAGRRSGMFTSPHLIEPTERIQIDGRPVSESEFVRAFEAVQAAAEKLHLANHPTYFETIAAMALWLFRERRVDIAVVEVGLGGRLDATNIIQPKLCVITPVDFDHEDVLGNTLAEIAAEKAGIIKAGVPVVVSRQAPDAMLAIQKRAEVMGAEMVLAAEHFPVRDLEVDSRGCSFSGIRCPLAGDHQVHNAVAAVAALQQLGVDPAGISEARWPGRLEVVAPNPDVILDGAHNPSGTAALARYLQRHYSSRRIWLIFGVLAEKSVQDMTESLFPLAHQRIFTAPANERALPAENLLKFGDGHIEPTIESAVAWVNQQITDGGEPPDRDAIVVAGSLYLVGDARKLYLHPTGGRW